MKNGPEKRLRHVLRYRWNHRRAWHRGLVRTANRILPMVPFSVKYGATDVLRRRQLPYRLLTSGSIAIQVGAPRDTLRSGRSRAMTFARRTAPGGRLLVVEPDPTSVEEFRATARQHGMPHVEVVCAAAWSERTTLKFLLDPSHPATNFTSGCAPYAESELTRFQEMPVEAVPIDELVADADLPRVNLVSITTNGAEEEILRGSRETLARFRPYVSLAFTTPTQGNFMTSLGYELIAVDDRGFTYRHR